MNAAPARKDPKPRELHLGPLYVAAGGLWHKRFGRWLPDGLDIWVGGRGMHLYWARGEGRRISFERIERREFTLFVCPVCGSVQDSPHPPCGGNPFLGTEHEITTRERVEVIEKR